MVEAVTVTPDDARALIAAGYRIIPLDGKVPITAWGGTDGLDPDRCKPWFPGHNVGILTGHLASGDPFFVVDVDDWVVWTDVCLEHGWDHERPIGAFAKVSTPSGGAHFYFMAPAGLKITNANMFPRGIDVRGEGGYVVAPPSEGYEWR